MNDLNAILLLAILVALPVYLICSGIRMMVGRKSPFTPVKSPGPPPIPSDLWCLCGIWQDAAGNLLLIQCSLRSNLPRMDIELSFAKGVVNAIPSTKAMRKICTQAKQLSAEFGQTTRIHLGPIQA